MIGVDLDDLRSLRPIIEPVLRQRAEGSEPRAERQHDIGLRDQFHRGLRALIAERSGPKRMVAWEGIVVQVGVDDGRLQLLGERDRLRNAVREDHAAARHDHRKLCAGEEIGRGVEALVGAGAAQDLLRRRDLIIGLAIEIVAGNVELRRPALGGRHRKAAREQFCEARMLGDMRLVFRDLREDRQLLGLLEAAEPHRAASRLRRDGDDGRVRPIGGGDGGDEIGDARPVLRDADAMASRKPWRSRPPYAPRPARGRSE